MKLRNYQKKSIELIRQSIKSGHKSPVLVISTGAGKTRIAAAICEMAINNRNRVLFLAPRRGLVFQSEDAFRELGIDCGIVMAGEEYDNLQLVDIGSMDTIISRVGRQTSTRDSVINADIIIIDECHTTVSNKRKEFLNDILDGKYGEKIIIGLTATPCTSGGGGLGGVYDDLVVPISMKDLLDKNYLVPAKYFAAKKPSMESVKMTAGEYNQKDLGNVFGTEPIMGEVLSNWVRIAENTITVIFTPTRVTAAYLVDIFNNAGYSSEYVDANTKDNDRAEIYKRLSSGQTKCLMNVGIVSMGVDIPNIQTIVMATATRSISKWSQACGRAMRPAEGKECCYIIDHGGMSIDENMGRIEDIDNWSLAEKEKIQDRILANKKEKKNPKEIVCSECKTVFTSRRDCPACGHEMKQKTEPLEFYKADLIEVGSIANKRNRNTSWEEKINFMGELKRHCRKRKIKIGWAAYKYKDRFGCWPNDSRLKTSPERPVSDQTKKWITARNIAWSKGHEKGSS